MGKYDNKNAKAVLNEVEKLIEETDGTGMRYKIRTVCDELSIFDWWPETIGISGLKAMRSFLRNAIRLGFDGYVCFKVGAKGCASGMWAYKKVNTNGYSPEDSSCIYRSFYSDNNYYDARDIDGYWVSTDIAYDELKTLRQLEKAMAGLTF